MQDLTLVAFITFQHSQAAQPCMQRIWPALRFGQTADAFVGRQVSLDATYNHAHVHGTLNKMVPNRLFKLALLGTLLVWGCTRQEKYLLTQAFLTDAEKGCDKICWFGIQEGVTTQEQALEKVMALESVQTIEQSVDGVDITWFTETTKDFRSYAHLSIHDRLVSSITITNLAPFTTNDFVELLGEPNEVSVFPWKGAHGEKFTNYVLYYSSRDFAIYIAGGNEKGPHPSDYVDMVGTSLVLKEDSVRQPWQGYDSAAYFLTPPP